MNSINLIQLIFDEFNHLIKLQADSQKYIYLQIEQLDVNKIPYPNHSNTISASIIPLQIYNFIKNNKATRVYKIHAKFIYYPNWEGIYAYVTDFEYRNNNFLNDFSKFLIWILYILKHRHDKTSNNQCILKHPLNIYIYLTPFIKQLPDTFNKAIDAIHVNTAFTTNCSNNPTILIFRKEEWLKVLIHESMHTFGLDFSHEMPDKNTQKDIEKTFSHINFNSDILLYESYTEFWARIIYIIFKQINITNQFNSDMFLTDIKYLKIHAEQCMQKILTYYNYNNNNNNTQIQFKENTNVFAYYFITGLMLQSWNNILQLFLKNNSPFIIDFNKNIHWNIFWHQIKPILIQNIHLTKHFPKNKINNDNTLKMC
tara:strand:+ start:372 stop:1481 length:1110 start_codon:yes stop_codon:yes gene_type:complete